PFMPLHPVRYAEMLNEKVKESGARVWLINTGWVGGPYGVGKRIDLRYTRSMVQAVLDNKLNATEYRTHDIFGLEMPVECPDVPSEVLNPRGTWGDQAAYDRKAYILAAHFRKNFEKFEEFADEWILDAEPKI